MRKSELRKIVSEEYQKVLNETSYNDLLSVKISEIPKYWSLIDVIRRYDKQIADVLKNWGKL